MTHLKNSIWKVAETDWVIMADMDEHLCVTHQDLQSEHRLGTSLLRIQGIDIIGESHRNDLLDIDVTAIRKGVPNSNESKSLCFRKDEIKAINYYPGAHLCRPTGNVVHSEKLYTNRHANWLGLAFSQRKIVARFENSVEMRTEHGVATHYTDDLVAIETQYNKLFQNACTFSDDPSFAKSAPPAQFM